MRGYYTADEAARLFGVVLAGDPLQVDEAATATRRGGAQVPPKTQPSPATSRSS